MKKTITYEFVGEDEVKHIVSRLEDLASRGLKFDLDIHTDVYSDDVVLEFKIFKDNIFSETVYHSRIDLFKLNDPSSEKNMKKYCETIDKIDEIHKSDEERKALLKLIDDGDEQWQPAF